MRAIDFSYMLSIIYYYHFKKCLQDSGLQDLQDDEDVEMVSRKSDSDYELDYEEDISAFRNYDYHAQLIETQMRYGRTDNEVCNLINSYLSDKGVEDPSEYLSPGKLRNCRSQHVFDLMDQHKNKSGFKVLGNYKHVSKYKLA